ncbi:MAG: leucine-rich repeat domain-containing protein [Treponema sp.]|jgi:hypothetical protein|nr:leucine-rich repeat domain-containing protein [Treponema sp.]
MKNKIIICYLLFAICYLFSACLSDWSGEGSITIRIGDGSRSVWDGYDISVFSHTIRVYNSSGSEQKEEGVVSGQTVQFSVEPGVWNITVEAYKPGVANKPIAYGSKAVSIKSGPNDPVTIKMTPFFSDMSDFGTFLNGLAPNTAATPYTIVVNVGDSDIANLINTFFLYTNFAPHIFVNLDLSGSTFTSIEDHFSSSIGLVGIIIPDNVTSIVNNAFLSCTNLKSVSIGKGVTSIGNGAFSQCSSLTSITIPNSVTSIEKNTFNNCSSLTSVSIPNSVTSIGEIAFGGCSNLTSVNIGNNVTSIGDSAFYSCFSLTGVTIPASVNIIEDDAFNHCSSLARVTFAGIIPESDFSATGSFLGDLRDVFYDTDNINGTPGTYTRDPPGLAWTRQ